MKEIIYFYVKGQGWLGGYEEHLPKDKSQSNWFGLTMELSVVAGYFYSPGDIFRDGSGNYYSVVSVQDNSINVRITNPIRYVLTGTVEI